MILPDGLDPTDARGVAIYGPRQWPNNIIPYDLSGITSIIDNIFLKLTLINYSIDAGHRSMIETALTILMDATKTPIAGTSSYKQCITFRPKIASDRVFVKVQYGTGCSASVKNYLYDLFK